MKQVVLIHYLVDKLLLYIKYLKVTKLVAPTRNGPTTYLALFSRTHLSIFLNRDFK